ncbi:GCN5 family acetyltransferase [Kitasatospora sp. MMS16-BH015]|uniref:GNAT family N-acetyltransferase n=1 Tax=Kitasatospora sp. MMS16-BH015 TaxID=2018025 RepID=UPI000CA19D67|nr:GNAT family protein [Kitasatospora sp. MMS16-BH015]AUG78837.1 GCN5 family acetyltransferase [Kitasatospora sp. MMS16-BH015]
MTAKLPSRDTVLTGDHISLEPLSLDDVPDLFGIAGGDEEVWRWQLDSTPHTEADMRALVEARLNDAECVPFGVTDLISGRVIGITCYFGFSAKHEELEIGGTWYARPYWRTPVNTEAKLLLLRHAFEELGFSRVMWKTHHNNERSQNAIRRLGASYEGTFRRHRRMPDGTWRDSVHFSMLREVEWPEARERLTARLAAG